MTRLRTYASIVALLALIAFPSAAQLPCAGDFVLIDYLGFAWEDGGVLPSNSGDVLAFTAVASMIDPIFGVDLLSEEVTIYVYDLVSTGEFNTGSSILIGYSGGSVEVYADPSKNHDWGVFPPNAQQSTFTDGTLLFDGDFTSFTLQLTLDGQAGAFEGFIDGVGGTVANACTDCAFTFGGVFGRDIAQTPDGYDLQVDGALEVCQDVSNTPDSFGSIKSLYR